MLRLTYPTSDDKRVKLAETSLRVHAQDVSHGDPRLKQSTVDRGAMLLYEFQTQHSLVTRFEAKSKEDHKRRDNALRLLQGSLRSLWNDVQTEVTAQTVDSTFYAYYGLTQSGSAPDVRDQNVCMAVAAQVLQGHYEAQSRPDLPHLDSSRVERALAQLQNAVAELERTLDMKQDAQEARRPLRKEINLLLRVIAKELRSTLVHESAHYEREVMRKYGFTFRQVAANAKRTQQSTPESGAESSTQSGTQTGTDAAGESPTAATSEGSITSNTRFVVAAQKSPEADAAD